MVRKDRPPLPEGTPTFHATPDYLTDDEDEDDEPADDEVEKADFR